MFPFLKQIFCLVTWLMSFKKGGHYDSRFSVLQFLFFCFVYQWSCFLLNNKNVSLILFFLHFVDIYFFAWDLFLIYFFLSWRGSKWNLMQYEKTLSPEMCWWYIIKFASTTSLSFWVNWWFNMVSEQVVQGGPVFKPLHCCFLPN